MNIRRSLPAVAGLFIVFAAFAAKHKLPTPPPSEFADAESSVNVPIPTDRGRLLRLTFAFDPSPTSAVQVALGNDENGDENLEPEETQFTIGCDCGEWFARREEGREEGREAGREEGTGNGERVGWGVATTNGRQQTVRSCVLSLSKDAAERWSLAKVTTHNAADTNVTVSAKSFNPGTALIVR